MTAVEILQLATRAFLIVIFALAVIDYARRRGRARLDIALMLGTLGVPSVLGFFPEDIRTYRPVVTVLVIVLLAQPWFALRLVENERPVARAWTVIAVAGLVLFSAAVIIYGVSDLPNPVRLGLIAYFAVVDGYVAAALTRRFIASGGAKRWRLGFAVAGTSLLILALLLATPRGTPDPASALAITRALLPVLLAICWYVAFVPPAALRQLWMLAELHLYLKRIAGAPPAERARRAAEALCEAATRTTGGLASAVAHWDRDRSALTIEAAEGIPGGTEFLTQDSIASGVLTGHSPLTIRNRRAIPAAEASVAGRIGAESVTAIPIASSANNWGVLIVWLRRGPLFPVDDVAQLSLLCEQYAVALDNVSLVEEQHRLVSQLETSNKELEAFAYSVSHDLRGPLRAIDGFSQALADDFSDRLGAEGRGHIERVRTASQNMGHLIDSLLTISRVTRAELRRQPVDLSNIAREIQEVKKTEAPGRNARVEIGDNVRAYGDPTLVRLVLENLLDNAWKFTSKTESPCIEFGMLPEGGRQVYFVKDNGAGFDMNYSGKLFGAFQRLHRQDEFHGTGIGLATVHRIVSRHGGKVWATAAVGQGATFYFTLEPEVK